jgi:hypothetical protein
VQCSATLCCSGAHCGTLQCSRAQRCSAAKKATATLPSCFVFFLALLLQRSKDLLLPAVELHLLWSYTAAVPLHLPVEKLRCKEGWNFVLKKKMTTTATFFTLLQGNGEFAFLLWFCCEEGDGNNVITFLYGGGYYIFFVVAYDVVP